MRILVLTLALALAFGVVTAAPLGPLSPVQEAEAACLGEHVNGCPIGICWGPHDGQPECI